MNGNSAVKCYKASFQMLTIHRRWLVGYYRRRSCSEEASDFQKRIYSLQVFGPISSIQELIHELLQKSHGLKGFSLLDLEDQVQHIFDSLHQELLNEATVKATISDPLWSA